MYTLFFFYVYTLSKGGRQYFIVIKRARDNRNVLLDNACLFVEAMGNDKCLLLGLEKKWT